MKEERPAAAVTLAVAVNNQAVLEANLLASPALHENPGQRAKRELLIQEGYSSAAEAYNQAIERSPYDLIVFLHQDIYLPSGWFERLQFCIARLEKQDPAWGVAGCWGATRNGVGFGHVYSPGVGVLGERFDQPQPVQTLDEIVLVMKRSRGLRFDPGLDHFHFYGADLCLEARARGLRSYAISAFCVHNGNYQLVLPPEFYQAYGYFKGKWRAELPVQTPCIRVSRFDRDLRERRVREWFRRLRGRMIGQFRAENPALLYEQLRSQWPATQ